MPIKAYEQICTGVTGLWEVRWTRNILPFTFAFYLGGTKVRFGVKKKERDNFPRKTKSGLVTHLQRKRSQFHRMFYSPRLLEFFFFGEALPWRTLTNSSHLSASSKCWQAHHSPYQRTDPPGAKDICLGKELSNDAYIAIAGASLHFSSHHHAMLMRIFAVNNRHEIDRNKTRIVHL